MTPTLTQPRAATWQDVTARFWGGASGDEYAAEATFGAVTLTVYRDRQRRWRCRCQLWAAVELDSQSENGACAGAVEKLRATVADVVLAMEG